MNSLKSFDRCFKHMHESSKCYTADRYAYDLFCILEKISAKTPHLLISPHPQLNNPRAHHTLNQRKTLAKLKF